MLSGQCDYCGGPYNKNTYTHFDRLACPSCISEHTCQGCNGEGEVEYHTSHAWFAYCKRCDGTGVASSQPKREEVAVQLLYDQYVNTIAGAQKEIALQETVVQAARKKMADFEEKHSWLKKDQSSSTPEQSRFSTRVLLD